MKQVTQTLEIIHKHKLYPKIHTLSSAADPEVTVSGRKVLLFCSNDYLGLANHPLLKQKAREAIDKYGVSTCASRLIAGNTELHNELEKAIADFLKRKDAVAFSTGYMTNLGAISGIVKGINIFNIIPRKTLIISEELNHASIIDGCKLSGAPVLVYAHKDTRVLEKILKKHKRARKLVITDAVFSMDGDIAPVPAIVELAKNMTPSLW